MAVLPGVLGCRPLRRTVKVRLGTNPAVPRDELPGGPPIFVVSRQQFMKYPGLSIFPRSHRLNTDTGNRHLRGCLVRRGVGREGEVIRYSLIVIRMSAKNSFSGLTSTVIETVIEYDYQA